MTVPLVLPPVVGGVALFLVARPARASLGRWLYEPFGVTIPFTTAGRRDRRDVRRHAVPGHQRRGRAAGRRRPLRGRRRHARRRPLDDVPPGHPAAGRARASPPARCSAGRGRWASSARRSPSPATSPGRRRPCRSPSTWPCSATPRRRSCCRWCCSSSRWPRCCCCATAGWAGPGSPRMSLDAHVVVQRGIARRSTSTSRSPTARCSPSSARTAPASPRCCGCSPGCCRRTAGRVVVDGTAVWDDAGGGTCPPHRRALGMVFQDHLLFPHLSVTDNVAFGLRTRGAPDGGRPGGRRAAGWTGSGWRARATAGPASSPAARPSGPRWPGRSSATRGVLLLDEPLSALDARTRLTVRAELRRHLAEFRGQHGAGHPRPGRRDGAGRPGGRRRGRPGRPGRHARRGRAGRRAPTTSPGWSACRCCPAPATGRTVAARRRRRGRRRRGGRAGRCSPPSARSRSRSTWSGPTGSPRNVWPATLVGATPHGADGALRAGGRGAADRRRHRDRLRRAAAWRRARRSGRR